MFRAEDTAFEQRSSLKARGNRWNDGESKRVKAWWLLTNDPQTELDWLRADIYGDDRDVTVLKVPATRRFFPRGYGLTERNPPIAAPFWMKSRSLLAHANATFLLQQTTRPIPRVRAVGQIEQEFFRSGYTDVKESLGLIEFVLLSGAKVRNAALP